MCTEFSHCALRRAAKNRTVFEDDLLQSHFKLSTSGDIIFLI